MKYYDKQNLAKFKKECLKRVKLVQEESGR